MTETTKPVCSKCGNDGTQGGLYVTVDARWTGTAWELEFREDEGGGQLDCIKCDTQTGEDRGKPFFPYGPLPLEPLIAWRVLEGER